jgi:tetratricopeptide (TPR) repeat protein
VRVHGRLNGGLRLGHPRSRFRVLLIGLLPSPFRKPEFDDPALLHLFRNCQPLIVAHAVGYLIPIKGHLFQSPINLMAVWPQFPKDPPVLTGIGQVLLGLENAGQDAASVFERAIQAEPDNPANYVHAALAWKAAHDEHKAVQYLEKALRLDPVVEQPYLELAAIYAAQHQPVMVHLTYERYLKAFPQSIEAQKKVQESASY